MSTMTNGATITVIATGKSYHTAACTIPHSAVPFVVSVVVSEIGETGLKMTVDGDDYLLQKGENRLAELLVGDQDLTLNFSGRGSLQVLFRRRVI